MLGASGAISGVPAAYGVLYPRSPTPSSPTPAKGGAFVAHVGGFLSGLALLPLLWTQEPVEYDQWER
jgi:membrane associated rhomboid family serine protease